MYFLFSILLFFALTFYSYIRIAQLDFFILTQVQIWPENSCAISEAKHISAQYCEHLLLNSWSGDTSTFTMLHHRYLLFKGKVSLKKKEKEESSSIQESLLPVYVIHTSREPPSMYINSTLDSGFLDETLGLILLHMNR